MNLQVETLLVLFEEGRRKSISLLLDGVYLYVYDIFALLLVFYKLTLHFLEV